MSKLKKNELKKIVIHLASSMWIITAVKSNQVYQRKEKK